MRSSTQSYYCPGYHLIGSHGADETPSRFINGGATSDAIAAGPQAIKINACDNACVRAESGKREHTSRPPKDVESREDGGNPPSNCHFNAAVGNIAPPVATTRTPNHELLGDLLPS